MDYVAYVVGVLLALLFLLHCFSLHHSDEFTWDDPNQLALVGKLWCCIQMQIVIENPFPCPSILPFLPVAKYPYLPSLWYLSLPPCHWYVGSFLDLVPLVCSLVKESLVGCSKHFCYDTMDLFLCIIIWFSSFCIVLISSYSMTIHQFDPISLNWHPCYGFMLCLTTFVLLDNIWCSLPHDQFYLR